LGLSAFAQKVGTGKYRHYVSKLDYGNKQIGDNVTTFWLEGPSVFPQGQVDFLRSLYWENFPSPKQHRPVEENHDRGKDRRLCNQGKKRVGPRE